jgi:gas vesicle protein
MKTDKVILGVLGGIAAGAILGILFAKKGKNKKIKNKTMDYADELKYQYDETANNLSKKYDSLKRKENLIKEGKSKLEY